VLTIWVTPRDSRILDYSARLIVQIGVIPDLKQSLISIRPIYEQAAVRMTHLDFSCLSRSTMQTAVIGFTTKEATSSRERSSLIGKDWKALVTQYSDIEPPYW